MQPQGAESLSCRARWRSLFDTTLRWMEQHVDRFLLGRDPDHVAQLARIKLLAELALACDLGLMAVAGAAQEWSLVQAGRLRRLQWLLRHDLGDGRRPASLMRGDPPPDGVQLSALASLADILGRWGAADAWPGPERPRASDAHPPWIASLDVVAACRGLGFDDLAGGGKSRAAGFPTLPQNAAYALAHVIMFRTHFGRGPGLAAAESSLLCAWVPVWQRQMADAGDVDLLGELTIAARCLGIRDDPFDVAAVIQQSQEADGAVVGLHEAHVAAEAGAGVACAWFKRRYHTTVVANVAASFSVCDLRE